MKKSILTIAFVSFALVATSFTTVEASNSLSTTLSVDPPTGGQNSGGATGGGRKLDFNINTVEMKNSFQSVTFGSDSQSTTSYRKVD